EEIYLANVPGSANQKALRYMYNPIKDTRSPNCYTSTLGSLDVHYSSGVANHFFYLLAEGSGAKTFSGVDHTSPTCNGSSLSGIGRDAASKIWFRALTVYMTSSTNYAGARAATIKAANDLHGVGSIQANAVAATWSAVSVN
ncbi:MAG: M4 family metallopeptidase, partial [Arenimonas sp.]